MASEGARRRLIKESVAEPWYRLGVTARGVRRRLAAAPNRRLAPVVPRSEAGRCAIIALVLILLLLPLDSAISHAMLDQPPGVGAFFGYATDVGLSAWYLYPSAAILLLISVADHNSFTRAGRVRIANLYAHVGFLLAGVGIAAAATQMLKVVFGRARPFVPDVSGDFDFFRLPHDFASFPSGHSTTMGAVTLTLMIWFPALRLPVMAVGASLALSRVVVRAHYPSDVVAGFTVGMAVVLLLARWLARRRILYAFAQDGRGWRGLLPVRADRWRGVNRHVLGDWLTGMRRRR